MGIVTLALSGTLAAFAGTSCGDLTGLSLPNAAITAAVFVSEGAALPAHCRVGAVLTPSPDSRIEMELWLPDPDAWNGKFLAVGNGGWAGSISTGAIRSGVARGYATASNDTGHQGASGAFAPGHPEKVVDFSDRAMHEMTVQSKTIIGAFYDSGPRLSYYEGCSTGGRQGLAAAQRYPADFDALVIGAPVYNQTRLHASQVQKMTEILADPALFVPREKIALVADAVLGMCDASDGVADRIVSNPEACGFAPRSLACAPGEDPAACLSPGEAQSLARAYSPVRTASGDLVYPGHARGFEPGWRMPQPGSSPPDLPLDTFRYLAHQDADWDWRSFDLEGDLALALENAGHLEATDPDLTAFRDRGGKMVIYHGWNDPGPSPYNTLLYYQQVGDAMGPDQDDWLRVFMMPGVAHCGGGVGPDQADFLGTLEDWQESGIAPSRITASRTRGGTTDMTRPLCPYPEIARWTGAGSTNDAENFRCDAP
jgi:feruloyl esterase